MKLENGWYKDANENKWNSNIYTMDQAREFSESLSNCYNCINCSSCSYCSYCSSCSYCRDCSDYKSNPIKYVTPIIGSRNNNTYFYSDDEYKNIQVVCGCFKGDLIKFEKEVLKTHKDNEFYREQYLKEINKVKFLFEIE